MHRPKNDEEMNKMVYWKAQFLLVSKLRKVEFDQLYRNLEYFGMAHKLRIVFSKEEGDE